MTDTAPDGSARRPRIELIDILRALALVAMASYHFTWDLDAHGYIRHGLANSGGWKLYARCIASSFLFLVGVSLVLAHGRGIRWRPFWTREAQVAAGALAVTVATFFLMPTGFIFFGILHQIALASLIGLLFLRLPPLVTLGAGVAAIALPFLFDTALTEPKWLAWIGLATRPPVSNDYVPVFPWTGVVLLGIAAARAVERFDGWRRLARLNEPLARLRPFAAFGRHSLLFYLLHQPILFGLVAAAAYLFPPDQVRLFDEACQRECRASMSEAACHSYCGCVESRLKAQGLMERLLANRTSDAENERIRSTALQCSFDAGG